MNMFYFNITAFLISALSVYLLIWVVLKTPLLFFFRDRPGIRKVHQRIVPRIGGICMVLVFLSLLAIWKYIPGAPQLSSQLSKVLFFTGAAIFIIGIFDDAVAFLIQNKAKLILELLIAAEMVFLLKYSLQDLSFFGYEVNLGIAGPIITILWVAGVANAVNIIDGIDGLAGSIMISSFAALTFLAFRSVHMPLIILCVIMMGIIVGFLGHNRSPARVFLGDTGSLFLGAILGILVIEVLSLPQSKYPAILAPMLVAFPLLDISVAMLRRFFKSLESGRSILNSLGAMTIADNDHMHHRLLYRGLDHTETCIVLVILNTSIAVAGIALSSAQDLTFPVLIYTLFLVFWVLQRLHFFDRVKKYLKKLWQPVIPEKKPLMVLVISDDMILQQALKKFDQSMLWFDFLEQDYSSDMPSISYSAVLLDNMIPAEFEKDLNRARAIAAQCACPVVLVTESNLQLENQMESGAALDILLLKKPLYVPALILELTKLVKTHKAYLEDRFFRDTRHIRPIREIYQ